MAVEPVFLFKSQCGRKKKFTRKDAARMAEQLGQRVYKCVYCKGFHLTSRLEP